MENKRINEGNTLIMTSYSFKILLDKILDKFKTKYKSQTAINRVSQLYGFGNYNVKLPNIGNELEDMTGAFINGKYLYDKRRELLIGKPILKLNGYYKTVLFQYIGYNGIEDFIQHEIADNLEKEKQLDLIYDSKADQILYYICYHFGEYKEVIKSQFQVTNNWKNCHWTYLYPQKDGSFKSFIYHGVVKKRADILHIHTKTMMDGKLVNGGDTLLYAGHSDAENNSFMLGVFSAFDINNRLIAGKQIHEKCNSKEDMLTKSMSRKIPAYIAQELRNFRIENDSTIPNSKLDISSKSPYSITYDKIPGDYCFTLKQGLEVIGDFKFSIDQNTFKLVSQTEGILINKDNFELIQNGTVIHFSFQLTGIALFTRLEAFVKSYYLSENTKDIKGVYSGLDIENRLIAGDFTLTHSPPSTT